MMFAQWQGILYMFMTEKPMAITFKVNDDYFKLFSTLPSFSNSVGLRLLNGFSKVGQISIE